MLGLIIICILVGIISFLITNMVFNKLDNNSDNTDNNNTNVINDNSNKVVTSDHITNDKVQAVYDQVKIELSVFEKMRYYEDGFFDNLNNKINIILTTQKWQTSKLNSDNISYLKQINNMFNYDFGFIPTDTVINKIYEIYNIKMSKSDFVSLENDASKEYGLFTEYRYCDKIDGFILINWGAGFDEVSHNEVYSYTENGNKAFVDTLLGVAKYNYEKSSDDMCNVFDLNNPIYEHIDIKTFKFSEEDKDKFTKIRYTFTKRNDGSYYVSDIKKIN